MNRSLYPVHCRMGSRLTLFCTAAMCFLRPSVSADILYVTNYSNNTIEQFDGSGNGTFFANTATHPIGIAADGSGNLYVATDNYDYQVDKYNSVGVQSVFISHSDPSLSGPKGLAFDSSGNLYVSNTNPGGVSSAYIEKYDSHGLNPVTIENGFANPFALAFDSSGNVYVAEWGYGQIYKIAPSGGETLFATPSPGGGTYGLAIDSAGDVYASSNYYGYGTIDEYNSTGALIQSVSGSSGTWSGPAGMTFDSSGNLFVANSTSNSIEEFPNGDLSEGTRFDVSGTLDNPEFLAFDSSSSETSDTPEPGSLALLSGLSLVGTGVLIRRRRR